MSIVLVIIGLIAGAILVGQNLIFAAQVQGTISAMDRYKQAYNTFLTKYNCVPSDCPSATSFGLFSAGVCQAGGVPNSNSNGDGDGYIYSYADGSELPNGNGLDCESWSAFGHLYSAHLIHDDFILGDVAMTNNVPLENAFMYFTSLRPKNLPSGYILPDKSTNYLYIGIYPRTPRLSLGRPRPSRRRRLTPSIAKSTTDCRCREWSWRAIRTVAGAVRE
jgi:hypothetical protein